MKLTREQVAQLSDVELNRGIAWCYPTNYIISADAGVFITKKQLFTDFHTCVDYLTDYNLTMPLAHKLNFIIDLAGEYPDDGSICWSQFKEYTADNENPLRAICEVLLMIAMEREK